MTLQLWSNVRSTALEMDTTMAVVTPTTADAPPGVLILLHGLTGNDQQYLTHLNMQLLADTFGTVIALPQGSRSFWINQAHGLAYGTWVGEELPRLLRQTLRVSHRRADTIIGGLSMGGYGAFRAAFDYPQNFGGAFSLSGTLDVSEAAFRGRHPDLYDVGFGDPDRPGTTNDLLQRLQDAPPDLPPLYLACGSEDRLWDQNQRFVATAIETQTDFEWVPAAGAHNFQYWGRELPDAIAHFFTPLLTA